MRGGSEEPEGVGDTSYVVVPMKESGSHMAVVEPPQTGAGPEFCGLHRRVGVDVGISSSR